MIKYTLYIGCNDKDRKVQVIPSEGIRSIITQTCMAAGLDGFTLSNASGVYKHDDGSLVIESTYRLEILFASDAVIRKICDDLKKLLNQESIAVQVDKVNSYLA